MARHKLVNGIKVPFTAEEETARDLEEQQSADKSAQRKLEEIKEVRLKKLKETDYLANSDMTMPDNIKTWRQSLRDLPQNNTTEEQYDLLLVRDENENSITYGQLTNAIWSKP